MIQFFGNPATKVIAVASSKTLSPSIIEKLHWLLEAFHCYPPIP